MLTERNIEILRIIIEEYISTGDVLGSKLLLKKYDLGVSSATVRNDMAKLETLELLYQPYNSAGRLPTSKGIRAFVNYLMKKTPDHFLQSQEQNTKHTQVNSFYDLAMKLSYELAQKSGEIAFVIYPEDNMLEFSGAGAFLEKNHCRIGNSIFSLIKMMEEKKNFIQFIEGYTLGHGLNIFIGEENSIDYLNQYTLIIKKLEISGKKTYIGLIGSLKMNYSFNISLVNGII